jgi:epoxide hydrolase-like predicted phosphatase
MTVRVVCFDLGGVVIRICRSFEEAALQAGVRLRHAPDEVAVFREVRRLVELHQIGRMGAADFHRAMSDAFDRRYAADEIARIHRAITRDEYDGICDTIREIRGLGLTTACLSNTNDAHWDVLLPSPALQALDHRFASHLWGLAKPDPSIYRRFERELGVSGGEIVFFDDLAENVDAALALGWDAVLVDHAGDTARQVRESLAARGHAGVR